MRDKSHTSQTFTAILRDAVEAWRKDNGWSRESVVMQIVEAHERIDGPNTTGINFAPPTRDSFERAKVNADRVFRWLDDVTKDTNPCPPNFIPSILAALPLDRRMALVNQWMRPFDISCRPLNHVDGEKIDNETVYRFKALVKSSADAQTSVANLLDGIDPGELERAQETLCSTLHNIQHTLEMVEGRLASQKVNK